MVYRSVVLLRRLFNNIVWLNYIVVLDYKHTIYSHGQRHVICWCNNLSRYMLSERIEADYDTGLSQPVLSDEGKLTVGASLTTDNLIGVELV